MSETPQPLTYRGVSNLHALPRVVKVVVASGVGKAAQDAKLLDEVSMTLSQVTGQKPKVTRARKAIASFKVRQGAPVGLMVTLRGKRMKDFLARLVNVVLPRIRDFRGLPTTGFDTAGNYNIGVAEQTVFPEVSPEKVQQIQGMQITIQTTAKNPEEGKALLSHLGFPFKKEEMLQPRSTVEGEERANPQGQALLGERSGRGNNVAPSGKEG